MRNIVRHGRIILAVALFASACGQLLAPLWILVGVFVGVLFLSAASRFTPDNCGAFAGMDIAIICYSASTIAMYWIHPWPVGLRIATTVTLSTILYFLIRHNTQMWQTAVYPILVVIGAYLSFTALGLFATSYIRWRHMGFGQDLSIFKVNVPLLTGGIAQSDHVLIFLLLLAYYAVMSSVGPAMGGAPLRRALTLAMVLCILFTFSRALYFCCALLLLAWWSSAQAGVMWIKKHGAEASGAVAVLVAILWRVGLLAPIATTIGIISTPSQVRSALGRAYGMRVAWRSFSMHPGIGIGLGKFSLFASSTMPSAKDVFIGQSFNAVGQIAAEQGLIGLIALSALIWSLVREWLTYWRYRTIALKTKKLLFLTCAAVTVVGIYNMFENAWLASDMSGVLLFSLLAILADSGEAVRDEGVNKQQAAIG
jgi:hypothetical protein